jgi:hypothetical protein
MKNQEQDEQSEWAALIALAKQRQEERQAAQVEVIDEAAAWTAAIDRAKAFQRPAIDQSAWEERIARARRRPTPAASEAQRPSLRDRLERLVTRAGTLTSKPSAPRPSAAPTAAEEAQWRAAIHRAKTGNA